MTFPATGAPLDGTGVDNEVAVQQLGQWALIWRRFRQHRFAVAGLWMLFLLTLAGIFGPLVAPAGVGFNPQVVPQPTGPVLWPLTMQHVFGTDAFGTPITRYVLLGARATLAIGVIGAVLATLLGSLVGGVSGYFRGVVDAVLMRVVDAFLTIPFLPLLMVLVIYLPDRSVALYVFLFGITGWAGVARLVRSSTLSLREREYVQAARALGATDAGVIMRHLLPNALDILVVAFSLNVATFVLTEATLDFLKLGPDSPTWGQVLSVSGNILALNWWMIVFPGGCLLLTVLSINFFGDGMRDALDVSGSTVSLGEHSAVRGTGRGPIGRVLGQLLLVMRTASGAALGRGRQALPQRSRPSARPVAPEAPATGLAGSIGSLHAASRRLRGAPFWLVAIGPLLLALVLGDVSVLAAHSPLRYSPNYSAPVPYADSSVESSFAAVPWSDGWAMAYAPVGGQVAYRRVDRAGRVVASSRVGVGDDDPQPSLALHGASGLVAWVAAGGTLIRAARVGSGSHTVLTLNEPGGQVEHPYVVAAPHGGFDVLFEWGTGRAHSVYDLYRAHVSAAGAVAARPQRLVATQYGFYPRGVYDSSGALDMISMDLWQPGTWNWDFRRFTPAGRQLGHTVLMGRAQYFKDGQPPDPNVFPYSWGATLQRGRDGSIWAAWIGDGTISVERWSSSGRITLPATVVLPFGAETPTELGAQRAVGLALTANGGGIVYHTFPGEAITYVGAVLFDRSGQTSSSPPARINFDPGGQAAVPIAGTVAGTPSVIWQKVLGSGSVLQGASYHRYQPPGLLTRLGLNIGNLPANIALVLFGSLTLGVAFTVLNLLVILAFVLLWMLLDRLLPSWIAWPLYALVLAVAVVWAFGLHTSPPGFLFALADLGLPDRWIAAAIGIFTAWWTGLFLFRRQESVFRAASMAFTALYAVAIMSAVLFIEGQIGRI